MSFPGPASMEVASGEPDEDVVAALAVELVGVGGALEPVRPVRADHVSAIAAAAASASAAAASAEMEKMRLMWL